MTAQIAEQIIWAGDEHALLSDPLADYLSGCAARPEFAWESTALWRGYLGSWQIVGDELHLMALKGRLKNGQPVSLSTIFPGSDGSVFAAWYSGELRIPRGRLLHYVHRGFDSIYRTEIILHVGLGRVVRIEERRNR